MRITRHGNDLLITDQALGSGGFLLTLGVLLLVTALARLTGPDALSLATALYGLAGAWTVKLGLNRLVATQLIVDRDAQLLITKRWSFAGATTRRIAFAAVKGFTIEPEGQDRRTSLTIQTDEGPVLASGGTLGARAAWEEIVAAVEAHMGRGSGAGMDA